MTLVRSLYKNYVFVVGAALILLGMGNYLAAGSKTHHYQTIMSTVSARQQPSSSLLPYESTAYFPSEARERWEIARAKRDFYQVVLSAGRLMMGLGFLCMAMSLIQVRRQRTLQATTLFSPSTSAHHAESQSSHS
jgi:hypothetical protein